jgi:hypothetical protein
MEEEVKSFVKSSLLLFISIIPLYIIKLNIVAAYLNDAADRSGGNRDLIALMTVCAYTITFFGIVKFLRLDILHDWLEGNCRCDK